MILVCQDWLTTCNKCTTLVRDIVNGGGYACIWVGNIGQIYVASPCFFCESKTFLKIKKVFLKINFLDLKKKVKQKYFLRQVRLKGIWGFCFVFLSSFIGKLTQGISQGRKQCDASWQDPEQW